MADVPTPEQPELQEGDTCTSCGDVSTLATRTLAGDPTHCPICGTIMLGVPDPLAETEQIGDAIQPSGSAPELPATVAAEATPLRTTSAEKLLLERLIATPPIPPQAPMATVVVLMLAIFAIGIGIYYTTQPKEAFLKQTGASDDPHGTAQDSVLLFQKRTASQPVIDSLKRVLSITPDDQKALLDLADVDYDAEYWQDSKKEFEAYLKLNPKDVDARVDYASTIDRADDNTQGAINEIERALQYDPQHVRGLFNAGILSLRGMDEKNHKASLDQAKSYLERARKAAEIRDTAAIPSIDRILSQFEKMGPAMNPANGTADTGEVR